jgi:hypothetical protein
LWSLLQRWKAKKVLFLANGPTQEPPSGCSASERRWIERSCVRSRRRAEEFEGASVQLVGGLGDR